MITRNPNGQIVKIETETYPVERAALVKKREETAALLAMIDKDIADFDALSSGVQA